MKGGQHGVFRDGRDDTIDDRRCRRNTQLVAIHAAFTKELLSFGLYAMASRSNILTAGSMIATDGGRGMRCTRRRWAREMIAGGIYVFV
jgi:hypothetical protein